MQYPSKGKRIGTADQLLLNADKADQTALDRLMVAIDTDKSEKYRNPEPPKKQQKVQLQP